MVVVVQRSVVVVAGTRTMLLSGGSAEPARCMLLSKPVGSGAVGVVGGGGEPGVVNGACRVVGIQRCAGRW